MSDIPLLPHQIKVLQSTVNEVLLLGGIGSGKSHTGAHWLVNKIAKYPGCDLFIGANTYAQLQTASIKAFTDLLDFLKIRYHYVKSGESKGITVGDSFVYLYSLDKPDNIRGIEYSFQWLDEIAYADLKALRVVRGRRRSPKQTLKEKQTLMTTSGNGFNFLYDIFGNIKAKDAHKRELISAMTKDNVFLAPGTYEELLDMYGGEDSPLAQQELMGKFVNLQEGAIYNMFDRDINLKPGKLDMRIPVMVGIDFNIDKMSAVYVQETHHDVFHAIKEVQLTHRDANTYDLAERINKDLKGFVFTAYPDSTANARKSSTVGGLSDHQILRDHGINLSILTNPPKRDRQNSVNILFRKKGLFIDPDCNQLIKDVETLSARDDEGKISHLGPALGYVVWGKKPLRRPTPQFQQYSL